MTAQALGVLQMRLVVEADDYEEAVRFYSDVLGATEELQVHGDGGERVTILDVGRATLEISSPEQVAMIDRVEVGRRVSPRLRVAFQVADAQAVTQNLVHGGAELLAPATRTPWGSLNSRLAAPGGLQITVFEEPAISPADEDNPVGAAPLARVNMATKNSWGMPPTLFSSDGAPPTASETPRSARPRPTSSPGLASRSSPTRATSHRSRPPPVSPSS